MPRKTVKADIPIYNINKFISLIEKAWSKHSSMAASSPFFNHPDIDMARYDQLKTAALQKRAEALRLYDEAEALMQESRQLMGIDKGQTVNTVDTLYYMLKSMKMLLLVKHQGVEESLQSWGYNTVIRMSPVGRKKKKKV
jgi:hypothetical protein